MCGIAGIISSHPLVPQHQLKKMADALAHRGPQGHGFFISENNTVGFAHTRLSILDLSSAAAEPFHYLHYTIIYNGEIYNYIELKALLKQHGYEFTTNCDVEVIPAAYDLWKEDCLQRFDGMFAFALYDKKEQSVFIARDRFGEKPLYFSTEKGNDRFEKFFFASEMKALWAAGSSKEYDGSMLLNYLTLGYVQNPVNKSATFYKNISCLPAGHYLTINLYKNKIGIKKWYDLKKEIRSQKPEIRNRKSVEETVNEFSQLFFNSVQRRLRSDVPIGTSLSGGIDSSSVIAAIDQFKQKNYELKNWSNISFTAIFPGYEKNESERSKMIAEYFRIGQFTINVTAQDWIKNFDRIMYYQEEPLQSSSVLTQFMVYGLAKEKGITVLLDGQGADEILGGYKKYAHWFLQQLLTENYSQFAKEKKLLKQNELIENWGWKNYAAAFFPKATAMALERKAFYEQKNQLFIHPDFLQKNFNRNSLYKPKIKNLTDILYYNTVHFGLAELLRYADRNSMAHSLEVRLPFLSNELVEFVFLLPASFKIKNGFTKWILRESMQKYLLPQIAWQKNKIGYEPPQKQWMQQPAIIDMINESKKKLIKENILKKEILSTPVIARPAHDAQNFDWRYLCAASVIK